MHEPVNLALRIVLHIVGILLVMMAILILLKGLGLLPTIPEYVVWALILLALGTGIIGGLRSSGRK
ncbi:MAG: hypothetical protein NW224_02600 [Leptolyngbyaceae cyanobacterium bins.302]|nr:hypothetical protein [Leptolyngbyaceae cyanobacterium bins.302]